MKMLKTKFKKYKSYFIFVLGVLFSLLFIKNINYNKELMASDLPVYTQKTLQEFNGEDLNKPVLIAYLGYVYDVSVGREEFYNIGKDYHYLAGRDSTIDLNIAGGVIIKRKYKVVGIFK